MSPMPLAEPDDWNDRLFPKPPLSSRKKWMAVLSDVPMLRTVAVERTSRSVVNRGSDAAASSQEVTPKFT